MAADQQEILFCSRRWSSLEGNVNITLINAKTGKKYEVEEHTLQSHHFQLGDFLIWIDDKLEKINYLPVEIDGNIAYVSFDISSTKFQ